MFEVFIITYLIIALTLFLVFLVFTWGINWTWNLYQELSKGFIVSLLWGLAVVYVIYELIKMLRKPRNES